MAPTEMRRPGKKWRRAEMTIKRALRGGLLQSLRREAPVCLALCWGLKTYQRAGTPQAPIELIVQGVDFLVARI